MLFASFDFLLFFGIAWLGYWALTNRPRLRIVWVVAASYFFYMAGPRPINGPMPAPWYFAGLLLLSTVVDYVCGLAISASQRRATSPVVGSRPRDSVAATRSDAGVTWLLVSLVTNIGLLGYFKYTGFLLEVISETAALFGKDAGLPSLKLLLPVGISFYTFQSLSYTIDVYRGRLSAERNFLRFACFVAFFPQLVAGPIVRATEFLPQLRSRVSITRNDVDFALWRIAKGLTKKILLGDFIAIAFSDSVFAAPAEHSSLENLLALYAFTLQIYADFSGYSDIAIGAARLLGFRIPENFNRPYQAVDIADFWRRWHITLSSWLRDYLYYPLGGSQVGPTRAYLNLWVTMLLVGIWHGASWNFVIYANLQAGAMVFNRYCRRSTGPWWNRWLRTAGGSAVVVLAMSLLGALGIELDHPWLFGLGGGVIALLIGLLPRAEEKPTLRPLHVLLTVHFSVLSRVFFRADSLDLARSMVRKLIHWDGLGVREGLFRIPALSSVLSDNPALRWAAPLSTHALLWLLLCGFALHYTNLARVDRVAVRTIARMPAIAFGIAFAALLGFLSLPLAGPRPNIYFNF